MMNITELQNTTELQNISAFAQPVGIAHHVGNVVFYYLLPGFIALGSVGNSWTVWALHRRRRTCQTSVILYTALLLTTHTLLLWLDHGLHWISGVTGTTHVVDMADWLCRLHHFSVSSLRSAAAWLVVLITTDRLLVLLSPTTAARLCTFFTSRLLAVAAFVGVCIVNIHDIWTYELLINMWDNWAQQTRNVCGIDPLRHDFMVDTWPYISASLCSYVPLLIACLLSLSLLSRCYRYNKHPDPPLFQKRCLQVALTISLFYWMTSLPSFVINVLLSGSVMTTPRRVVVALSSSLDHLYRATAFVPLVVFLPEVRPCCPGRGAHTYTSASSQTGSQTYSLTAGPVNAHDVIHSDVTSVV